MPCSANNLAARRLRSMYPSSALHWPPILHQHFLGKFHQTSLDKRLPGTRYHDTHPPYPHHRSAIWHQAHQRTTIKLPEFCSSLHVTFPSHLEQSPTCPHTLGDIPSVLIPPPFNFRSTTESTTTCWPAISHLIVSDPSSQLLPHR